MPGSLEGWIEEYRLAWENRDSNAAAALFTEDSTYRSNIFEAPHEGQRGVHPFVDGNRVAVEFWTTMDSEGNATTLPGCLLLDFADDWRCRSLREYWHFAPGLAEPPPGWGE
jgi:hypothetical protein